MQIYKFGGASIATPERMETLLPVIQHAEQPVVVVVSALGKTTNALEVIVDKACKGSKEEAHTLAKDLERKHLDYAQAILSADNFAACSAALNVFFTELQWAIDDAAAEKYDYSYDQVVCIGELLSTRIFFFTCSKKDWI